MPRGGRRSGTPGTAYSNRTDLQKPKVVPIRTGPSQQYGQNANLVRQQQAVPMAAPPSPPSPGLVAPPGGIVPLDAPSQRPDEHVMTGAPVGGGAGPEVLGSLMPQEADPNLGKMRAYLPVLELAASQPDSSPELRQL